jgi:hypothetical protein
LAEIPYVSFWSLQWGPEWTQAQDVDHGLVIRNKQQAPVENLLETAAAVMQCDVVLTVDTMVAHVGGALGKPVWVLLHFDSDWRWMLDRLDSPWYPTMRLFRQRYRGDWHAPIQAAAKALRELVSIHIDMFSRFDISNASVTVIRVNDRDASLITLNNVGALPV